MSRPPLPGLSPRVRGNPVFGGCLLCLQRSIPACAGEPPDGVIQSISYMVYPRVCGGTFAENLRLHPSIGLSPRVRGNRYVANSHGVHSRSIPACAGEPETLVSALLKAQVYPRVCGGTVLGSYDPNAPYGLSPRVRGNRLLWWC